MKVSQNKKVSFESLGLDDQDEPTDQHMDFDEVLTSASQLPQLSQREGRKNRLISGRRSLSVPRTATPVPPSGLHLNENADLLMDDMEDMDERTLLDLANAPPLYQESCNEMFDLAPNGEKRKTTPPDLLTLSNMYFERNPVTQVLLFE